MTSAKAMRRGRAEYRESERRLVAQPARFDARWQTSWLKTQFTYQLSSRDFKAGLVHLLA
jgi:hypothetical protein